MQSVFHSWHFIIFCTAVCLNWVEQSNPKNPQMINNENDIMWISVKISNIILQELTITRTHFWVHHISRSEKAICWFSPYRVYQRLRLNLDKGHFWPLMGWVICFEAAGALAKFVLILSKVKLSFSKSLIQTVVMKVFFCTMSRHKSLQGQKKNIHKYLIHEL